MSTILVTIVTRHNLPNYLFIKQMDRKAEKHIFITTNAVENSEAVWLANAVGGARCQSRKSVKLLDEDDYAGSVRILEESITCDPEDKYLVNLTGGTKAMALAVHDVMAKRDSRFYSVTQNGKFIYDYQTGVKKKVTETISLEKYLALYDITIENRGTPKKEEDAGNIFRQIAAKGFDKLKCDNIREGQQHPNLEMRKYLMGEWFEYYCYFRIRKDYGVPEDAIAQGVSVIKSAAKMSEADMGNIAVKGNEIDVIFVKDNTLYVCECKVGVPSNKLGEVQYKAAAIAKYLGFGVRPYIFWLQDMAACAKDSLDNIRRKVGYLGMSGVVTGGDLLKPDPKYLESPEIR